MSDTDSPLSDAPSDLDEQVQLKKSKGGILKFFTPTTKKAKKASSPPPIKRSMTPPRETVLADNEAIAVSSYPRRLTRSTRPNWRVVLLQRSLQSRGIFITR